MAKKPDNQNPDAASQAVETLAESLHEISESAQKARAKVEKKAKVAIENATKNQGNEELSEFAKRIWLAGLGAYGKAFDEAQALYGDASKKGPEVLDDLIARGKKLEEDAVERLASSRQGQLPIEERIDKMRQNLGLGKPATRPKRKRSTAKTETKGDKTS